MTAMPSGLVADSFLELLDHLLRIPVGEDVAHLRAEVGLGLLGAVVHVVGEHAARRAAGEEGDAKVGAPVGRIGRGGLRGRLGHGRSRGHTRCQRGDEGDEE